MDKLFSLVILAGGLATRLGSLSKTIPKSLILIDGEPFIAHQLRLLKSQGFEKVILCIGYLGDLIRAYVKDGKQFGLSVAYSDDGKKLLGTAGALYKATSLLEENFFVLFGDSYLPIDYRKIQNFFERQAKPALMTVFKNNDRGDNSNIEFNNNRIIKYDKKNKTISMNYIDFGLSLFKKNIFSNNVTFSDLSDLYQILLAENRLVSYEVFQNFYEIGSINGLNEFKKFVIRRKTVA
ncbi:nucleotidyltransferase family protein [Rickettsiella endosymbiont of Aleochara curtula]|uniref:nucleotidyltransferase family protein n=1 Tax=Rickettsiella endosymbiont of Aleochara curtula TaxID=3077936 RepID=UPI00313E7806